MEPGYHYMGVFILSWLLSVQFAWINEGVLFGGLTVISMFSGLTSLWNIPFLCM